MRTTRNDYRRPAIVVREHGWSVGTRLVGDEGNGPTVIEITAVGEENVLAKTISRNGKPSASHDRETLWSLSGRDWKEQG